jgi:hypothetical protein
VASRKELGIHNQLRNYNCIKIHLNWNCIYISFTEEGGFDTIDLFSTQSITGAYHIAEKPKKSFNQSSIKEHSGKPSTLFPFVSDLLFQSLSLSLSLSHSFLDILVLGLIFILICTLFVFLTFLPRLLAYYFRFHFLCLGNNLLYFC